MKFWYLKKFDRINSSRRLSRLWRCGAVVLLLSVGVVVASAQRADNATIRLDLPDPVSLERLLDFASQRLSLNIIYDPARVRDQVVSIKSPAELPADTLRELIDEVLRSRGLVLAADERAGWFRVVGLDQMAQAAQVADEDLAGVGGVLTRVFPLNGMSAKEAADLVTPFLTPQAGQGSANKVGRVAANPTTGLMLVTDYASNIRRIEALLEMVRAAAGPRTQRYYSVQHLAAIDLNAMLLQALGVGEDGSISVDVIVDEPANRLLMLGGETQVEAALKLAASIDVDPGLTPKVYRFKHTSPERFETQMQRMLEASVSSPSYESSVDAASGMMILTAPPAVHRRVEALREQLDVPTDTQASPIRFYPVKNANAADLLETIRGLEDEGSSTDRIALEGEEGAVGSILPPGPGQNTAPPPTRRREFEDVDTPFARDTGDQGGNDRPRAVRTANATLTADENTNSIIVVAAPATQAIYAKLIEELDRRRAQVMIEVTLVTLDTSDNFSLGVEILGGDNEDSNQSFVFNNFGLNEVTEDGQLTLSPGLGFNGVVLSPDIADVIVQALKTDGNTRVVSAPRILVNDNETGSIASVLGQPVASINQGQNSDTVTFEGFVEAGTSIEMTPHIAEGDHLRLEFAIALDAFDGEAAESTIPPPRQSSTVESHVTLPDGATIVVGGINFDSFSEQVSRIPILGEIPVLEFLFSSRDIIESQSTLFVFLRPVILRDEDFSDLRFYSRDSREAAGLEAELAFDRSGYPVSQPLWVW